MGYQPLPLLSRCPCCESICGEPSLKRKGWVRVFWKYECGCGVSGPWQLDRQDLRPESVAASGWEFIAGKVDLGPPPPKK